MRRIMIVVATVLSLVGVGQMQAQARARPRCPSHALALKTKQVVVFKVRMVDPAGSGFYRTTYIACWRATGVHHAVTGQFGRPDVQLRAFGAWVAFARTDGPDGRGDFLWVAGTRNARTGAWGPIAEGYVDDTTTGVPKPSLDGPPGVFAVSSNGLFAWRVERQANTSEPAHAEILAARKGPHAGARAPEALMDVRLASAAPAEPGTPPFSDLAFRDPCVLTWKAAPGVTAPTEADVCAAATAP